MWIPADTLSASGVSNPIATPVTSTQYFVYVTDSTYAQAGGSVIVNVGLAVEVTATPAVIDPGQSAQLAATVRGGTPPYTYVWTPAATLDNASAANPIATPSASTTYTVTVTDWLGSAASETVNVTVHPSGVSACIASVVQTAPLSVQADGSCSSGPIVTYRWWSNTSSQACLRPSSRRLRSRRRCSTSLSETSTFGSRSTTAWGAPMRSLSRSPSNETARPTTDAAR